MIDNLYSILFYILLFLIFISDPNTGKALTGLWLPCVLFLVLIFQSSVRSSLLVLSHGPEVDTPEDANVIHSLFLKIAEDWPEERYIEDAVNHFGEGIRDKVGNFVREKVGLVLN